MTTHRITLSPGAFDYLREWYVKTGRVVVVPRALVTIEVLDEA